MLAETKDEMRERILEAALKRFTHYTASKTTMNEIADDLHCSKASLYYYFPDKKSLHVSVLEKIGEAYFRELEAEAAQVKSATRSLQRLIEIRQEFVQRFCRLELFKLLNEVQHVEMMDVLKQAKEREAGIIARIIEAGVASGEFRAQYPEQIAILYNQAMMGLRFSVLDTPPGFTDLQPEDFEKIVKQQQLLTEIFIKALKDH
jgi:TetR/AcrR family transcriptional regulator